MMPKPEIERIREDRYTWKFDGNDGPEVVLGYAPKTYAARITSIYARFAPEGELLSVKVYAKKLKKDGTLSTVRAWVPYAWEKDNGWEEKVRQWRAQSLPTLGSHTRKEA